MTFYESKSMCYGHRITLPILEHHIGHQENFKLNEIFLFYMLNGSRGLKHPLKQLKQQISDKIEKILKIK